MQRRDAAVSAALFLLIAAGAYAFVGAASQPSIEVDPAHAAPAGEQFVVGDVTYNVTEAESGPDGSATVTWTNSSVPQTATLAANDTVDYRNATYRVSIPNESDPASFTLVEELDVTAILSADPDVENETITRADGREYVVYREDGSTELLSEYLPEPDRETFDEGDSYPYQETEEPVTVDEITSEEATLSWTASEEREASAAIGGNVTLANGEQFLVYVDGDQLQLVDDPQDYLEDERRIEAFEERMTGLRGLSVVSGLAAILLVALAYLPSRY